jgi:hypothetical protein
LKSSPQNRVNLPFFSKLRSLRSFRYLKGDV